MKYSACVYVRYIDTDNTQKYIKLYVKRFRNCTCFSKSYELSID